MLDKLFFGLLLFVPVTLLATYLHAAPSAIFFLSALAIIPLTKFIAPAKL